MSTAFIVAGVVSAPFVVVLAANPVVRRLALRYPRRRLMEATLVVLGSLLGTGIITGSLIVGDTISRSIRAGAYDQLGPVDEVVSVSGLEEGRRLTAAVGPLDGIDGADGVLDGMLSFVTAPVALAGERVQARAQLIEVDFDEGRRLGDDPSITGLVGPTPSPGRVVVAQDAPHATRLGAGRPLSNIAVGQEVTLTVDRVLPRTGLAGFWPIDQRQQSYNVFVTPGSLAAVGLADADLPPGIEPPRSFIAFSNVGGVEDGAALTDEATAVIEEALDDAAAVQPVKRDLITVADATADSLTQLYITMGMFSVAAGVLLLVNIFVMLAEERRSQLGMLRALGLRRSSLIMAFTAEGWIYALVAGAVGSVLGVQIGRVIAWRADSILSTGDELYTLDLTFAYESSTVAEGFAIGLAISVSAILLTSVWLARLNVIAAIRNLPTRPSRPQRRRRSALGTAVLGAGLVWSLVSFVGGEPYGVATAPMVVAVGIGVLAAREGRQRATVTAVSAFVLTWGTLFIPAFAWLDIDVGVPIFLVQGISMCAAAVALLSVHQSSLGAWLGRRFGRTLPMRIGLAYPIVKRFRTSMTLGMFGIVLLTMVYLSVISVMFRNQIDDMTADLSGGFGVMVTSNPTDPVDPEALAATDGVAAVAPLAYSQGEFVMGTGTPTIWAVTGFGPELAAAPPALSDRGGYATDEEAWQAVLDDPSLVIVDQFFLSTGASVGNEPAPGLQVVLTDPFTGRSVTTEIAALATADFIANGAFYGIDGYREVFGARSVASRFAVRVEDDAALDRISDTFTANGAETVWVRDSVEALVAQNTGFFTLMQQFVGVGLLIGIAGIGVVMVRSVRERRRDVGVLRSLGFQPGAVTRSFILEATFVALEGVLIGVTVALVGTYGLVLNGTGFMEGFRWAVPWREVAGIAALALTASALTAIVPSRRAGRIRPAEALRVED